MTAYHPQPANGTLLPLSEREDHAHIDFVIGFRKFLATEFEPILQRRTAETFAAFETEHGHPPQSLREVRDCLESHPTMSMSRRLSRVAQENTWVKLLESYEKREDDLIADLDAADGKGPGTVSWDPDFAFPDYFEVEYHLQPGGFHRHPLMGAIYQYGSYTIIPNAGDGDAAQRKLAAELPGSPDGIVRRVLDLGCSVGQTTTALKQRFPDAEVWGVDAGAPMVRYAHKRAAEMGVEVHFAQKLAEHTGFPDAHFDIVVAFILLHEVPLETARRIIAEAHRMLRPGGVLVIEDVPNFRESATPLRHFRNFNITRHNAEPYWCGWTLWDLKSHLRTLFAEVRSRRAGIYDLEGNDDQHIAVK